MIGDVLHGLPGALLVGLLPGVALATLLAPGWRWWERLVAAPGLSVGIAGVLGLLLHDLRIPFEAATVVPVDAGIAIVAVVLRRRGAPAAEDPQRGPIRLAVAVAVVVGVVGALLVVVSQRDQVVPIGTDSAVHGGIAQVIADQHDSLAPVPVPVEQTGVVRSRTALEATAALVSELGGPAPADAMLPLGLLAVVVLPLALVALALEATGSARIAVLAPLLAAGMPFPRVVVEFGGYPLLLESSLVVPMVLAAGRVAAGRDVGAGVAMAAAGVASMWVTHGTELVTVVALAAPLCVAMTLRSGGRRALRRLVILLAGCGAAALAVGLLTRLPQVAAPVASPLDGPTVVEADTLLSPVPGLGLRGFWTGFTDYVFPEQILVLMYVAGVAASLVRRQARWILAAHALLLGALADDVLWGHLHRLWDAVFPWSSRDRLGAVQYWVLPLILGLGAALVADVIAAGLPRIRSTRDRGGAVVALAGAVAVIAVLGFREDATSYSAAAGTAPVTAVDTSALQRMSTTLPPAAVVLTDGTDDAGQWVGALTRQHAFFQKGYLDQHDADARIVALQQACTVPVDPALFRGIDAVYVGARHQANASHPWSLSCVRSLPWLQPLVDSRGRDGEAVVFTVDAGVRTGAAVAAAGGAASG